MERGQMSETMIEVNDANFESEVLKSTQPVLVDFWAAWCGPCRAIGPTVESIAEKYQGRAKVVKVNVDENVATPASLGIRGIPTLILFRDGKEAERVVGVPPNANEFITQLLDKHLSIEKKNADLPAEKEETLARG
jgi:thioredoxin 1